MGHLYHGYVKLGYVSHNQRVNSTSFSTGDLLKKTQKNTSLTEKIPLRKNQTRWENPPSFSDFRERFPAILLGISRPCLMTKPSQESGDVFFFSWAMVRKSPAGRWQWKQESLIGGIPTPLKNDGVRQWLQDDKPYMKWKIIQPCLKPPTRSVGGENLNRSQTNAKSWSESPAKTELRLFCYYPQVNAHIVWLLQIPIFDLEP